MSSWADTEPHVPEDGTSQLQWLGQEGKTSWVEENYVCSAAHDRAIGNCGEERKCLVWGMRGVTQPDTAHTGCKTSDIYQALLAGWVQTGPRRNFKQVYFGLWVWSSHCELHSICEGADWYHPQLQFQFILEEFLWKYAQEKTTPTGLTECWWRLPSHIPNYMSVLFCQTVMTENSKYNVYSSGLQKPVCCFQQPSFGSWEFF